MCAPFSLTHSFVLRLLLFVVSHPLTLSLAPLPSCQVISRSLFLIVSNFQFGSILSVLFSCSLTFFFSFTCFLYSALPLFWLSFLLFLLSYLCPVSFSLLFALSKSPFFVFSIFTLFVYVLCHLMLNLSIEPSFVGILIVYC